MIKIELSPQDIPKIKQFRYEHTHPMVRRRMHALWLKSRGLQHGEICRLSDISNNTLCKYLRMYQSGGIGALTELRFHTPTSALDQYRDQIAAYFLERPPATINEAADKIEELTGLKRSPGAVGQFLKSLGMRPRKVGATPAGADPNRQEEFRIKKLEPRIEEAKQGRRALFLSMLPTLYSHPFSAFYGHLRASL